MVGTESNAPTTGLWQVGNQKRQWWRHGWRVRDWEVLVHLLSLLWFPLHSCFRATAPIFPGAEIWIRTYQVLLSHPDHLISAHNCSSLLAYVLNPKDTCWKLETTTPNKSAAAGIRVAEHVHLEFLEAPAAGARRIGELRMGNREAIPICRQVGCPRSNAGVWDAEAGGCVWAAGQADHANTGRRRRRWRATAHRPLPTGPGDKARLGRGPWDGTENDDTWARRRRGRSGAPRTSFFVTWHGRWPYRRRPAGADGPCLLVVNCCVRSKAILGLCTEHGWIILLITLPRIIFFTVPVLWHPRLTRLDSLPWAWHRSDWNYFSSISV
jgi:hypothetical protein